MTQVPRKMSRSEEIQWLQLKYAINDCMQSKEQKEKQKEYLDKLRCECKKFDRNHVIIMEDDC